MFGATRDGFSGVERVAEPGRRLALSLILTGRLNAEASAVDVFLDYVREQGYPVTHLFGLYDKGVLTSAAIALPAPGRGAMVFVSAVGGRRRVETMQELVELAVQSVTREGVRFAQALLDPEQTLELKLMESVGFQLLAKLVYMRRSVEGRSPAPESEVTGGSAGSASAIVSSVGGFVIEGRPVELRRYSDENHGLFERAVLASYEDTRDCPALVGKRAIGDVMEGHRSTGLFLPEYWGVLLSDGEPAGVLLCNALPARDAMELVYLGVSKPYRGRGIGGQLVRQAIRWSERRRVSSLYLAVDEQNTPAVAMYRGAGFRAETRKLALMREVGGA